MTTEDGRRKISVSVLGTRLSFKLPKVRLWRRKKEETEEAEWRWQGAGQGAGQHQPGPALVASHEGGHRFLSRDQVASIHQWLDTLPGDMERMETCPDHHHHHHLHQQQHTDIF